MHLKINLSKATPEVQWGVQNIGINMKINLFIDFFSKIMGWHGKESVYMQSIGQYIYIYASHLSFQSPERKRIMSSPHFCASWIAKTAENFKNH